MMCYMMYVAWKYDQLFILRVMYHITLNITPSNLSNIQFLNASFMKTIIKVQTGVFFLSCSTELLDVPKH